jgi:hypothetical protein
MYTDQFIHSFNNCSIDGITFGATGTFGGSTHACDGEMKSSRSVNLRAPENAMVDDEFLICNAETWKQRIVKHFEQFKIYSYYPLPYVSLVSLY